MQKKLASTIAFATMGALSVAYATDRKDRDQKIKTSQASIERLEKKIKRLRNEAPSWVGSLIKPIAEAMAAELNQRVEISGPFGLGCNVLVFFYDPADSEPTERQTPTGYLKFTDRDLENGEVALRDYTKDTGGFGPNSIGRMNDLHQPHIPIPTDADLQWFLDKMKELSAAAEL